MSKQTILLALVVVMVGCGHAVTSKPQQHLNYIGTYQDFNVEIEDAINDPYRGSGTVRIMHLRRTSDSILVSISGHDTNNDGRWDRVFRCGYPEGAQTGCNSYEYDANRIPKWTPCPADKDTVEPWTMGELLQTEALLNGAMIAVHNPAHLATNIF